MYEEYFNFAASPFRLNPDPKFFFGSRSHNKAMAYLHYGLRQGEGFIVITGEIGAGKSILIGHLLDQLDRSNVVAAHLLTANLEPAALLSHVLSAFRVEPAGQGKSAEIEAFEDFLFDQMNRGRRVLLIVDESQNLPIATIEELRMLSNLDYEGTPLFQVFLVGQPEFRAVLAKPEMEQLRQRVNASYHLEPLGPEETTDYIKHRLSLVGWSDNPRISDDAFQAIFAATAGVPRKINKLCNRLLLHCSIEKLSAIDASVVTAVAGDLKSEGLEQVGETGSEDAAQTTHAKKSKAGKKRAAEFVASEEGEAAIEAPKRAVGDDLRAPLATTERSQVVIPFESLRKAGLSSRAKVHEETASEPPKATDAVSGGNTMAAIKRPNRIEAESMSVLDRLRLQRDQQAESNPAREEATLSDVANAIAAASAGEAETPLEPMIDEGDGEENNKTPANVESPSESPLASADLKNWRQAVAKTIDETRDELKVAHTSLSRLNKQLTEIEKRRRERRSRLAASLARAEALIADLRNSSQ